MACFTVGGMFVAVRIVAVYVFVCNGCVGWYFRFLNLVTVN